MAERLENLGRHFRACQVKKAPIKVTITGAAGNIGYALVFMIGQGRMFGPTQPVDITLLEIPQVEKALEGVVMELKDCALPLIRGLRGVTNYKDGFDKCEVAILVGAKPRGPGMERKDLLGQNALIFRGQGQAIRDFASKDCKVLVVGNPANTNAMIASIYAEGVPKENFTSLTRLDQNRAIYQVAEKLNTKVENIKNLIIWGNHSTTQFPDVTFGEVRNFPTDGKTTNMKTAINDENWVRNFFIGKVAKRGAEIIQARKSSSAASAANAVCDHIHDWIVGTRPGEYVSMGVISDGSYGVPKGLNFSFPVECADGKWKIVQGLKWDEFSKGKIDETTKELVEERDLALEFLKSQK